MRNNSIPFISKTLPQGQSKLCTAVIVKKHTNNMSLLKLYVITTLKILLQQYQLLSASRFE